MGSRSLRNDARRAWQLSRLVHERGRFAIRETVGTGRAYEYRLHDLDATSVLRHNRADAWVMHEVVAGGSYLPPPEVERVLPPADSAVRVLDLGGNVGLFGLLVMSRWPQASIVAFEPDPDNAGLLQRCIALNELGDRWSVVQACAAPDDGEVAFVGGGAALSHAALPGEKPNATVPALDVFPYLEGVDLAKIDIEGGEWDLLGDERFAGAAPSAVLLEWHSYQCPASNPRTEAERQMRAMGFEVRHERAPTVSPDESLWGAGVLWAWRPT